METGSEHETCRGVELEALVSYTRRVRRQDGLGCGARLGLVTFAREQGPDGLEDGLGTYYIGSCDIDKANGTRIAIVMSSDDG